MSVAESPEESPFRELDAGLPRPIALHMSRALVRAEEAITGPDALVVQVIGGAGSGRSTAVRILGRAAEADGQTVVTLGATPGAQVDLPQRVDRGLHGRIGVNVVVVTAEIGSTPEQRTESLTVRLQRAAEDSPRKRLLLLIDDVHLADGDQTVQALDAVATLNGRGVHASVVVTRPEVGVSAQVESQLAGGLRLRLQPWDAVEVRAALEPAFVQRAAGGLVCDEAVWRTAHDATGGWPPAVQRFGRALWEAQRDPMALGRTETTAAQLATSRYVLEETHDRLVRLPEPDLAYLRAIATTGANNPMAGIGDVRAASGIDAAALGAVEARLRDIGLVHIDHVVDRAALTIPAMQQLLVPGLQTGPRPEVPSSAAAIARTGLPARPATSGLPGVVPAPPAAARSVVAGLQRGFGR